MISAPLLAPWCAGVLAQGAAVAARVAEAIAFEHPERTAQVEALLADAAGEPGAVAEQVAADAPGAAWLARLVGQEAAAAMAAQWAVGEVSTRDDAGERAAGEALRGAVVPLAMVPERYDAIVCGTAAGAAVAAAELTRLGARVVVLVPPTMGEEGGLSWGDARDALWVEAAASGLMHVAVDAQPTALHVDRRGMVTSVTVAGDLDGFGTWRTLSAREVFVGLGAVESARLLLASAGPAHPQGLANAQGLVGRGLRVRALAGAWGVWERAVDTQDAGSQDADGARAAVGVPPTHPAEALRRLQDGGALPLASPTLLTDLVTLMPRMRGLEEAVPLRAMGNGPGSRVVLDPARRDGAGMPRARLKVMPTAQEVEAQAALAASLAARLRNAGAVHVAQVREYSRTASDAVGTLRAGEDPATSVTSPEGRVWGHPNLWVVDGAALSEDALSQDALAGGAPDPAHAARTWARHVMRRAAPIAAG